MMTSSNQLNLKECACFGVAGNFTGHLEQAGEAVDFTNIKTSEANAPKALFPTYLPKAGERTPDFLNVFPFDSEKIVFPVNEEKIQIEPECAVIFNVQWKDGKVVNLNPLFFGASNDVSIRKEGAKKISLKKNWGPSSKGLSENLIPLSSFSKDSILDKYRIACFMVRGDSAFAYGEDSAVRNYSYIYEKLNAWLIEKLNNQEDFGPAEKISEYLKDSDFPEKIMVSIGATRYTEFGQTNFLARGNKSIVLLYPEDKYSFEKIKELVKNKDFSDPEISALVQEVVL